MPKRITYTARDESGCRLKFRASSAAAAAERYVTTGEFSGSTRGYVDVYVGWTVDGIDDEDAFRVPIPGWDECESD